MLWPACFITQEPLAARQAVDVSATSTHNTPAMSSPSQGTVATSKTTWPRHRPTDRGRTLSNPGLDTVSRSPVTQHPTVHRLVSEAVVAGRGAKSLGAFKTVSGPRDATHGLLLASKSVPPSTTVALV